ncbi:HAD superfamily hydrolase (TIGR01509 family) [Streptomyces sp. CG 926]|uniref:HAD family hydrolase n=1 Tax=Streptomyces sp. CG 926 TaxID=1882405 RepID=UPI000D6D5F3F|nr:HAD-IA family hydrolase [Streptomyces sp. CG 926]PWK65187.1 HAD superfamily hydrolase (TIGR01509 family) [Streptomyces sp. CG 926]
MSEVGAVVFDTDGVLLATAERHAAAWKEAFDGCLADWAVRTGARPRVFDTVRDYRDLVDGRSRIDGAKAFLTARRIDLPVGTPEDPPGCGTAHAVAARKERIFAEMLRAEDATVFDDVRPALLRLREMQVRCAAVSASRHARSLLRAANLLVLFEAVVDGRDADTLALPGKPAPDLFLAATERLGTGPDRTAVVEDAVVGVEAGRRGRFRLVVGLDRDAVPQVADALRAHGAHAVLPDLGPLPALLAALESSRP